MVSDHYLTMLVHPGISSEELTARWRKMARELHPDRFVRMSAKVQKAATERFAEVSAAYNVLSDAKARAAHDVERMVGHVPCGACRGTGVVAKSKGLGPREYKACGACGMSGKLPLPVRGQSKRS